MISIHEHSVVESLLTPGGYVLDGGCGVDFLFSSEMSRRGLNVISLDPNPRITEAPQDPQIFYERKALATLPGEKCKILTFTDTDAATIIKSPKDIMTASGESEAQTTTIAELMQKYRVDQLEVLKLDIEGSEYEILESLEGPIAKQISVEFHDFRNLNPCYPDNERYYARMIGKLSKWYKVVKHQLESHPGFPKHKSYNYWDSLFVLK